MLHIRKIKDYPCKSFLFSFNVDLAINYFQICIKVDLFIAFYNYFFKQHAIYILFYNNRLGLISFLKNV